MHGDDDRRVQGAVAAVADQIPAETIAAIQEKPEMPARFLQKITDPDYGRAKPLFRKISRNVRITVFEGGHEIVPEAALAWLEQQRKGRPAVWKVPVSKVDLSRVRTEAGK